MKIRNIMMIGVALVSLSACARVQPGNVGVQVTSWGGDAGVDPNPKGIGTYFTGMGTSIYEYPVSTQTYVWTKSSSEGNAANEEFQFNDSNGMVATADVGMSYHIDASKAPLLYQKYKLDTEGLIAGPIRNAVRNSLIDNASTMSIEEIYGPKKVQLISKTQSDVQKILGPLGIVVEQVYWAGGPRVPDAVMAQINSKIANEQAALAAQAKVAQVQAEAQAAVAKAKGTAEATSIEAEAIRSNPQILQQRAIEKWDGQLPTYVSGNGGNMMFNIPTK